jgi:hypothetical protein
LRDRHEGLGIHVSARVDQDVRGEGHALRGNVGSEKEVNVVVVFVEAAERERSDLALARVDPITLEAAVNKKNAGKIPQGIAREYQPNQPPGKLTHPD